MKAELHKVTFQLHGVIRDDGKVVSEIHAGGRLADDGTQVEFKLWEHELDRLPAEVAQIIAQIEQQQRPEVEASSKKAPRR